MRECCGTDADQGKGRGLADVHSFIQRTFDVEIADDKNLPEMLREAADQAVADKELIKDGNGGYRLGPKALEKAESADRNGNDDTSLDADDLPVVKQSQATKGKSRTVR